MNGLTDDLKNWLRIALDAVGMSSIELKDDTCNDVPCVVVGDYTLTPVPVQGKIEWLIERASIIRGCHTLPNGDPGYPDDVDVVEIGTWPTADGAARSVAIYLAEASVDSAIRNAMEEEMYGRDSDAVIEE